MEPVPSETREKVAHWIQEGLTLFPHLPYLVRGDGAAARAAELERDCEALRREVSELRRELDDVRRDHERLRAERDEVAQALSRLMDSVQPMSQIAQKLGVRRSPFERDPRSSSPATPPTHKPA